MATIYVRSSDGSDSDNGSTWALAKATLEGAAAIDAAGDTIVLASGHSESKSSAMTLNFAGTQSNPTRVLSVSDAAEPPDTVSSGASVNTTGGSTIYVFGSAYIRLLTISAGSGVTNGVLNINTYADRPNSVQVYDNCALSVAATGGSAAVYVNFAGAASNAVDCRTEFIDTSVQTASTSCPYVVQAIGWFTWNGGSCLGGGSSTSSLVDFKSGLSGRPAYCEINGVDLSARPSGSNIFSTAGSMACNVSIRNCKLPASWSGGLVSGTLAIGDRFELHNCDSGATNYRLWTETYYGSVRDETTIVRTGGANDGTTGFSWRMVSNANANPVVGWVRSPEIAVWNTVTSGTVDVTVETITDNVTLTDAECWIEVSYLGNASQPIATIATTRHANPLTAATDNPSSSATWGGSLGAPKKQKMTATISPRMKGYIQVRAVLAKASTTVYVDPKLTVS